MKKKAVASVKTKLERFGEDESSKILLLECDSYNRVGGNHHKIQEQFGTQIFSKMPKFSVS